MYLILLFSKDGRSWLSIGDDGKPLVADTVRPVVVSELRWRRLQGAPAAEGSGVFYYRIDDQTFQRAPVPAAQWADVLKAVTPASN